MSDKYKYSDLTELIIGAFYIVYNKLGYGFLEKVYENALLIELYKIGLSAGNQKPLKIYYDTQIVGEYFADIIVEDKIIIELKATESLCFEYECQLINYLKASKIEVGLLMNFGKEPEIKRKVFSHQY